ncbi:uncharacterized protein LOC126926913 [Bombus affinis]|uniref:uncharacterized protein LOC126926913 n=1 Tax=Bombus affinis TaxID=309941 RepID=UPI0021B735BE|nr:uncharacterized protein LOC126926913 [Bombus affinis]
MAQPDSISTLRRRRSGLANRFTITKRQLDEYEESGQVDNGYLVSCRQAFDDVWKKLLAVQDELEGLDEGEVDRAAALYQERLEIDVRFTGLLDKIPAPNPSPTKTRDSGVKPEPTSLTLPEVRAPPFDGALENWTYFYDTFSSTVDRNENLTNVQKFQYLRAAITGRAARSIQSLEPTDANYPIALNTLKEKFNCPLRICMRHWELMRSYPEIEKETPEAIEDLMETISVNLKALERLGQSVTSDVVLIELIASKLPSSSMRKWQRTLPNQEVPSYHQLMEFLKTRANGNQLLSKVTKTKEPPPKPHRRRYNLPHGRTYATTSRALVCPTCDGPHNLRDYVTPHHDLLVTAQIDVLDKRASPIRARALLDTGSSMNFMTEKFANSLGIKRKRCSVPIGALDDLTTIARSQLTTTIVSMDGKYERTATFLVIPTISSAVPDHPIDRSALQIPKNLKLADPTFHIPSPIEILLSSGPTLASLCVGQIKISQSIDTELCLQKTRFGWVIGGSPSTQSGTHSFHITTADLQTDLSRFWEIDEGPSTTHLSEAELQCEEHFRNHVRRNKEGRYIVALPFNEKLPTIGTSKSVAMSRLAALSRRFQRDKQFEAAYNTVIQEYLDLGHMTKIPHTHPSNNGYYLPHHGVIKESSNTTKLRVVFDGSAISTTGVSLNDTLHTGPKLQEDLVEILLRFRSHQYVLTGDIEKMYRQILVRPDDRKYQLILWRNSNGEIDTYQLNTVTFGLSAAPYLALRCLKQLAEDEGNRFPRASSVVQRDFYVDDALTGADTKEELIAVRHELTDLLRSGGLNIREWASNDKDILRGLSERKTNRTLQLGESQTLKTLGIYWDSQDDTILYSVEPTATITRVTKRSMSSVIARIYDPLGLLAPVIVRAKILLQRVWALKLDWDESLPSELHTEWDRYYTQLPLLSDIRFPRKTVVKAATQIELHGFCDASEKAYGACIYLRSLSSDGHIETQLLTVRSKVAPLKSLTIPRLELSGALLLTSLMSMVKNSLTIDVSRIVYWTDSTIVLQWIKSSPHTLKTFVANRVAEIQTKTNIADWRHVPTDDNPADLISRGQAPKEFLRPNIWKHGPEWLKQQQENWPIWIPTPSGDIPEQKKTICLTTNNNDNPLLHRYSSWTRLIRVVAWCLRWKHKQHLAAHLTTDELTRAHNRVIKIIQSGHFATEIRTLQKDRSRDVGGKLQPLNPFLDEDGILRVGGRLTNSSIPFNQKYPIILPKASVTELIINQEHRKNHHTGTQATLYAVRLRYWPIDSRSQVWRTIKRCVRCCRANPPPVEYLMGDLPEARITESRPFTNVGIDYCGPFYIKERRDRNRRKIKIYAAIFVCLATKAVHIELVSDLTTDAFLAALRRFISRRGHCATILTDNGTNFVGANRELQELRTLLQSDDHKERVQNFLADRQIQWRFNPPNSPHFGGLWEAAVKSFKRHLIRVVGTELLTFEHLHTLVVEIEAILNSRPLTPISPDQKDPPVLTPGHFLIGDTLTSLRERDFRTVSSGRLSSWQRIHQIKQQFWS